MQSEKLPNQESIRSIPINYVDAGKMVNLTEEMEIEDDESSERERRLLDKAKTLEKEARRELGQVRTHDPRYKDKLIRNMSLASQEDQNRLMYSTPEAPELPTLEEMSAERDYLLENNAEEYYKIGAMNAFAKGNLGIFPEKFIKDGFNIKDGDDFRYNFNVLEDYEAEGDFLLDTSDKAKDVASGIDQDKIDSLEKNVILNAIKRGCFIKANAYTEENVEYSLPIEQKGLVGFMEGYGIDLKDERVRRLSYSGFANIIKDMANVSSDPEMSDEAREESHKKGMAQLNWYFDNFGYAGKTAEEQEAEGANDTTFYRFLDRMHGQYEDADSDWRNIYEEFLGQREEYQRYFEEVEVTKEKDNFEEQIGKIANVEKIEGDFMEEINTLLANIEREFELDETDQQILRMIDEGEIKIEAGGKGREYDKTEQFSFIRRKILRFAEEIKRIKRLDPYADCYIERFTTGHVDKEGKPIKETPKFPYLVVRFGNRELGTNNVYAESTGFNGAFYAWKGGDSGESWRNIFAGSKRMARAKAEIYVSNHSKSTKPEMLEKTYDRVHSHVPLPTTPYLSEENYEEYEAKQEEQEEKPAAVNIAG